MSSGGFGDSNNAASFGNHGAAIFNDRLYLGSYHQNNSGGQVWGKTLAADFALAPARGTPPLPVAFSNTSSGDYTSSQWNGDANTYATRSVDDVRITRAEPLK